MNSAIAPNPTRQNQSKTFSEYRNAPINLSRSEGEGESNDNAPVLTFRAIFSTDQPVRMFDWDRYEYVPEILVSTGARFEDTIPLLDNHSRWSADDQLGSGIEITTRDPEKDDELGEVEGTLSFDEGDEKAVRIAGKIHRKHIKAVSVGYTRILSSYIEPNQSATISGRTFTAGDAGLRVTSEWLLDEISVTPIGADDQAKIRGFKSIEDAMKRNKRNQDPGSTPPAATGTADPPDNSPPATPPTRSTTPATPPSGGDAPTILTSEARADIISEERDRVREIENIASRCSWVSEEDVRNALDSGMGVDAFRTHALNVLNPEVIQQAGRDTGELGLSQREQDQYSINRVINHLAGGRRGIDSLDGLEREAHDALSNRYDQRSEEGNAFLIPAEITGTDQRSAQQQRAAHTVANPASAGVLVDTELRGIIDYLRDSSYLAGLNATFLTGLRDDLAFVQQNNALSAQWVDEEGELDEQELQFSVFGMQPKRLGALTMWTLKLATQSSWSIEAMLRFEIGSALGLGIDRGALFGTGGNMPLGLFNQAGVQPYTFAGPPEFRDFNELRAILKNTKAPNADSAAYLTTPNVEAAWASTPKFTGQGGPILSEAGTINRQAVRTGVDVPGDRVAYGIWSNLMIGIWGAMEMIVDPYTKGSSGQVRNWANAFADAAVKRPSTFIISTDAGNQ